VIRRQQLMCHRPEGGVMKQPYHPPDFGRIFCKEAALPALKVETSGSQNLFFLSLTRQEFYMQHSDWFSILEICNLIPCFW